MAEINHTYVEQLTEQTTSSTSFVDVTGAQIGSGSFVAGQKYLLVVRATNNQAVSNGAIRHQVIHGSTAFSSSEDYRTIPLNGTRNHYTWWTVWTAVSGEAITLQHLSVAGTSVGTDDICMLAMRLDADLAENTDWVFNENTTSTTLSSTYSTSNNASVTFTPGTAGHDWLVLSRCTVDTVSDTISYKTRIEHAGGSSEVTPEHIQEPGGGAGADNMLLCHARVYNLGAVSQTFNEEAAVSTTGTTEARLTSGIFALNLNKFKEHATQYTDGGIDLSATDYATEIATISITPSVAGDVVALGFAVYDVVAGGQTTVEKRRLQLDNTTDLPTTAVITYCDQNDARDQVPMQVFVMENLTAAAHTIDFDASTGAAAVGRAAIQRQLVAFTMELAGAPPTGVPNQLMLTGAGL